MISNILNSNIWLECQVNDLTMSHFISIDRKGKNIYKLSISDRENIVVIQGFGMFKCDQVPVPLYCNNLEKIELPMGARLVVFSCANNVMWSKVDKISCFGNQLTNAVIVSLVEQSSRSMCNIGERNKFSFMSLFQYEEVMGPLELLSGNIVSLTPLGIFSGIIKTRTVLDGGVEYSYQIYTYIDTSTNISVEDYIQPKATKVKFGTYYHTPFSQCYMYSVPCVICMTCPGSYQVKETLSRDEINRVLPKSLLDKIKKLPNVKIKRHEKRGLITPFLQINVSYYDEETKIIVSYNLQINNYKLVKINSSIVRFFYSYIPEHCEEL